MPMSVCDFGTRIRRVSNGGAVKEGGFVYHNGADYIDGPFNIGGPNSVIDILGDFRA